MIALCKNFFKRAFWSWKQPLTVLPVCPDATVSDLFVWRSSEQWQTAFELIDLPSLFEDSVVLRQVLIIFFNRNGSYILEKKITLQPNCRNTLDISNLIGRLHGEAGTFAVFHTTAPLKIAELGAFIAERGYVSYRYRDSPLSTYVHGNFDAIAKYANGKMQLIGGISLLYREYNLQFCFSINDVNELVAVNPSPAPQKFIIKTMLYDNNTISLQKISLPPGGIQIIPIQVLAADSVRVVIKSRLVMARPLVFNINNSKVNVFHG